MLSLAFCTQVPTTRRAFSFTSVPLPTLTHFLGLSYPTQPTLPQVPYLFHLLSFVLSYPPPIPYS